MTVIENIRIGQGPKNINIGLHIGAAISKSETVPFMEWLKENDLANITAGEMPAYLGHWRGLRDED